MCWLWEMFKLKDCVIIVVIQVGQTDVQIKTGETTVGLIGNNLNFINNKSLCMK